MYKNRILLGRNARRLARFHRDEKGASYLLPIALMVPFLVLFFAMTIEISILLHTRMVAQIAVYAAARAAVVWLPTEDLNTSKSTDYLEPELRLENMRLAAARAMWPAASGAINHAQGNPENINQAFAKGAIDSFKKYGALSYDEAFLHRKLQYAYKASTVTVSPIAVGENGNAAEEGREPVGPNPVKVELTYEIPFHTPGVGRLFGKKSGFGNYYVIELKAVAIIDQEIPRSENQSLGIRYYNRRTEANTKLSVSSKPKAPITPVWLSGQKPIRIDQDPRYAIPEHLKPRNGIPVYVVPNMMSEGSPTQQRLVGGFNDQSGIYISSWNFIVPTIFFGLIDVGGDIRLSYQGRIDMANEVYTANQRGNAEFERLSYLEQEARSDDASAQEANAPRPANEPVDSRGNQSRLYVISAGAMRAADGYMQQARLETDSAARDALIENARDAVNRFGDINEPLTAEARIRAMHYVERDIQYVVSKSDNN